MLELLESVLPERSHELTKPRAGATESIQRGRCLLRQLSHGRACAGHWLVPLEQPSLSASGLLRRVQSACPSQADHASTVQELSTGQRIGPKPSQHRSQQGCTKRGSVQQYAFTVSCQDAITRLSLGII